MRNVVKLTKNDIRRIIREVVTHGPLHEGGYQTGAAVDPVSEFVNRAGELWKKGFNPEDVSMDGMDSDAWNDEVEQAVLELGERVRDVFDDIEARLTAGEYA